MAKQKRIKRKGGSYSWTAMLFDVYPKAVADFKKQVADIWLNSSDSAKQNGALRIKFRMEWETIDIANQLNERAIAKDDETRPGKIPRLKNPLSGNVSAGRE